MKRKGFLGPNPIITFPVLYSNNVRSYMIFPSLRPPEHAGGLDSPYTISGLAGDEKT